MGFFEENRDIILKIRRKQDLIIWIDRFCYILFLLPYIALLFGIPIFVSTTEEPYNATSPFIKVLAVATPNPFFVLVFVPTIFALLYHIFIKDALLLYYEKKENKWFQNYMEKQGKKW